MHSWLASSPSSALTAASFTWTNRCRGFCRALVGLGKDRVRRSFGRVGDWNGHREPGLVGPGECRIPAEEREHPTPADDQVLLAKREQGGHDPVDEQPGRQESAVEDRDEREEQHRLTLDLG